MTEDGEPIRRIQLIRPMGSEKLFEHELASTEWKPAADADFERAWSREVEETPDYSTSHLTLVSGLLLPIWDRLPSENMRVYRLQAASGERVIGRLVTQEQLAKVYAALGIDCTVDMSAEEVFEAIMARRATIHLSGELSLRRARVMDGERMEVLGFGPSDLARFKALGCYTEIIAWKTRLFLPTNDLSVLENLLGQMKIVAPPEAA
jgi:hypothetical protein